MKTARYSSENVPKPARKDWDRLDRVKDKNIDCSDIPEITDFSKFRPWEGACQNFCVNEKSFERNPFIVKQNSELV
jgi:hypothetical protein